MFSSFSTSNYLKRICHLSCNCFVFPSLSAASVCLCGVSLRSHGNFHWSSIGFVTCCDIRCGNNCLGMSDHSAASPLVDSGKFNRLKLTCFLGDYSKKGCHTSAVLHNIHKTFDRAAFYWTSVDLHGNHFETDSRIQRAGFMETETEAAAVLAGGC